MNRENEIVLRRASMEDAELLFQWKNDKTTIENSISKRGVTMEEHLRWLEGIVDNPTRQLFILEVDGMAAGQLRLDIEVQRKEIEAQMKDSVVQPKNSEAQPKEVLENGKERSTKQDDLMAEISYGLGVEYRGKGFGKVLLENAELLANIFGISVLTAEVLPHNIASQKLFKQLGFEEEKKDDLYVYTKRYE